MLDDGDVAALFGLEMAEPARADNPTGAKRGRRQDADTPERAGRNESHHEQEGPQAALARRLTKRIQPAKK